MPATLGYLMALMYNPNNVALEGGPLTNVIEFDVGQQLCRMLGFITSPAANAYQSKPTAWGHITAGGSIANMEAVWCVK
jgi:glutamate/tyrosine decarboxylase-like PLP-dependent enzyme